MNKENKFMQDFSKAFQAVELPQQAQQQSGGSSQKSNIDWNAFNTMKAEKLGGYGKYQLIGVISNCYDLGTQEQDEQTVPVSDKDYDNHAWRLEVWENSGKQKDESASLVEKYWKGVQQECLVYTKPPVPQFAMTVDFPEVMIPYGDFFEGSKEAPLRLIFGQEGFKTKAKVAKVGNMNFLAKPFNLNHINVNRGKDGVAAHYALAKNGKVAEIAGFAGVLDDNGNFHAQEVGKLIGRPVLCEVTVDKQEWNDKTTGEARSKDVIDFTITGKLGPRDVPYYESDLEPKMTSDLFGFVLFNGENDENTVKTINSAIINTMKMSPDFEGSKLSVQLEALESSSQASQKPSQGSSPSGTQTPAQESKPSQSESQKPQQQYNEPSLDFEDDIPFAPIGLQYGKNLLHVMC